jgi:hypothetical protein
MYAVPHDGTGTNRRGECLREVILIGEPSEKHKVREPSGDEEVDAAVDKILGNSCRLQERP